MQFIKQKKTQQHRKEKMKRISEVLIKYTTNKNSHLSLTFGKKEGKKSQRERMHRKKLSFHSFILCSFLFLFENKTGRLKRNLFKMHDELEMFRKYTQQMQHCNFNGRHQARQEINS